MKKVSIICFGLFTSFQGWFDYKALMCNGYEKNKEFDENFIFYF